RSVCGKSFLYYCIRSQLLEYMKNVVNRIASAGAEGDYGLTAEIIGLQKGVDDHRGFIPPDRVSDKNMIIIFNAVQIHGDFRAGVAVQFFFSLSVYIIIRFCPFNLYQGTASIISNESGYFLGISCMGKICDQSILHAYSTFL